MRKFLLFVCCLLSGVLGGFAQVKPSAAIGRSSPPIVVERIYASFGDATAVLDSTQIWTPQHPSQRSAHVHIELAAPTYLYAILPTVVDPRLSWQSYIVLDGHQVMLNSGNGMALIERSVKTIDLHIFFLFEITIASFMRDAQDQHMVDFSVADLPQFVQLYFYGQDRFIQTAQYPLPLPGRVLASSVEEPATRYHPTFLFDGRDDFGWGTDHGQDGAGESVALSLDAPLKVSRLKIWNGQQGADSAFRLHPRVRTLLLSTGTDTPQRLELPDRSGPVVIDLPKALTSATFQLMVESVYPGQGSDVLVISELQLGDADRWYSLAPDREAQLNSFVRAKTQGTALGDVLGRPLCGAPTLPIAAGHTWTYQSQCMSFGTDGSFYFQDSRPGHSPSWGQGGWEHFLPQNGRSRVKVWGYRHDLLELNQDPGPRKLESRYFEADIELDAYQIFPNALLDAIPLKVRPDDFVPCSWYDLVNEDLRYRTADNFMGRVLYPPADCMPCLLRDTTARALAHAQRALDARAPGKGYRFMIWDAYRPYSVQKEMWAHTPDSNYVANPYTGGSSHNKGLAIDLTLVDEKGHALDMGTAFDDFSKKAHHDYKRLPKQVLANRALLKAVMEEAGFEALPTEWWHYRLPLDLPIADLKFDCGN